ncbi:MAG: Maf family protein [Deltaproteobacteria bacterium]|nr:Maf family protein [Deltaproteobacteria bacterium]
MRIILASTSPRRREILALLGLPFEVRPPDFLETTHDDHTPEAEAVALALGKARSITCGEPRTMVVGGDTLIALDDKKIGKPEDPADAVSILERLSGRTHRILTGVAMIDSGTGREHTHLDRIDVRMHHSSRTEIAAYVSRGESMDKAGAYSIQGEGHRLIEGIRGDYLAAVGLPLRPIAAVLGRAGVEVPTDVERLYRERSLWTWSRVSAETD